MSRRARFRWLEMSQGESCVEERLQDAPRPGTPPTFTLEQITQLYALACAPPEQYGRPISHWTAPELADELVKQGIVESISPRHVGRVLEEAELKPHQSHYWLHPPRPRLARENPRDLPALQTSHSSSRTRGVNL
jgi:putative transposase